MIHSRPTMPAGHGEVVTRPAFTEWSERARVNARSLDGVSLTIGDVPLDVLRSDTRREAVERATGFCERLGIDVERPGTAQTTLFVATGHQPELIHPGVWVKHLLVDRMRAEAGAVAIDLVVDTDETRGVTLTVPRIEPEVGRERIPLGSPDVEAARPYVSLPTSSAEEIEAFCRAGDATLSHVPSPAIRRHFSAFCDALREARPHAQDMSELVTSARRRYESVAGTRYLELPVSVMARTAGFRVFAAHLLLDARGFAVVHNDELRAYRAATSTRSSAQPFPDLSSTDDAVEAPFWMIVDGARLPVSVSRDTADRIVVSAGGEPVVMSVARPEALADALLGAPLLVPRALTLTMFARLVLADLFVHGIGGDRYDRVTDAVMRGYLGVEPPGYAVASMTMHLPVGVSVASDEEIARARRRLHRLTHNPDTMLGEVEFDAPEERDAASALAQEKRDLVEAIGAPGADKKLLGGRIREVNERLAALFEPLAREIEGGIEAAERSRETGAVLTDREYPFCLWSPLEIQDKVV